MSSPQPPKVLGVFDLSLRVLIAVLSLRRVKIGLLRLGAVVAMLSAPLAHAGKSDNTVRMGLASTPQSIDPWFNNGGPFGTIADAAWDTLIFRDPTTGEHKPLLATQWRWLDERTLELDLREGVRFHNGAELSADDVVYTLGFVTKPESGVAVREYLGWIERVEKVAPYRVRIVAKGPFPAAIPYLAMQQFVIHPHEYYAAVGPAGMNQRPVGTGPFKIVTHELGERVRLVPNPDYFRDSPKQRPQLAAVEVRFIPDAQTLVAEAYSGGLDLLMYVARDQAEQLREIPSLRVVSASSVRFAALSMNTLPSTPTRELLDIRVRQAIMHAIDREAIVRFVMGDGARVIHTECALTQYGCTDEGVTRYEFAPDESRRLLAEAGLKDGFAIDLYTSSDRNAVEAIGNYLRDVGIRARLRYLQPAAVISARREGRVALSYSTNGSAAINDVSAAVSRSHDFSIDDLHRDPEVRDLIAAADSALDPEARLTRYRRAFQLIAERAYVLPLYTIPVHYVAARDLVFTPFEGDRPRFWEMRYAEP